MKLETRSTRSNTAPPSLPGASAAKDDFKTAGRVSDAKLQFRPAHMKLNSVTPIISHAASLIKSVCNYKSYDCAPIWAAGKPQLSIALKFDIGPLGPRITLDPDKLIAADTEAVLDYISSQLSEKYKDLTAGAARWLRVRKELSSTIDNSYNVFLSQSTRKTNRNNSDTASENVNNA